MICKLVISVKKMFEVLAGKTCLDIFDKFSVFQFFQMVVTVHKPTLDYNLKQKKIQKSLRISC